MKKTAWRLVLPLCALVLTAALVCAEVFAWFLMQNRTGTGGVDVGVTSSDENLTVGWQGSSEQRPLEVLPGQFFVAELDCQNNFASEQVFVLRLEACGVRYPRISDDDELWRRRILTPDYYADDGLRQEVAPESPEAFFGSFLRPASNAVRFGAFDKQPERSTDALQGYLTEVREAPSRPVPEGELSYAPASDEIAVQGNSAWISGGRLRLAAAGEPGDRARVYLLLWFDPERFVTANGLTLRNSNAYLGQRLSVRLKLEAAA